MKTLIALVSLMLSAGAFSQGKSEHANAEKEVKKVKTEVNKNEAKQADHGHNGNGHEKNKQGSSEKGPKKNKAGNSGNAYGKNKQGLSGKDFGQNRAAAARAKSKKVKTVAEANTLISFSFGVTKKMMLSISFKLTEARTVLMGKLAKKEITQPQFDLKLKLLMAFDKRQGALMLQLK